jgi:phage-related protein
MRAKTLRTIELLEEFGSALPMPHSRKLSGQQLWELRIRFARDICRLFYFHHRGAVYVITSGYVKKSDRTSRTEIDRALRLKAQFLKEEER